MTARREVEVFSVSMAARQQLGDLPPLDEVRAQLRALPAGASPRERAKLHLTAAIVMQDRQEGGTRSAIEEARQAVELLSAEGGAPLAAARFHLGRLVLIVAVGEPTEPPDRASLAEARHILEQAHEDFEALQDAEALSLTAVELGFAAEREGEMARALEILDTEIRRAPETTRGMLRLWKATVGLRDPFFRREADAEVLRFLKQDARSELDEGGLCELLGMFHRLLSLETRKLALEWLEGRPKPPLHHVIILRSEVAKDAPETWIRPDERARLEAEMADPNTRVTERWHIAHLLMVNLPERDRELRLRCAEMLEEAIVSEEVPPVQRAGYQHDVGMAYMLLADGDRRLAMHAVRLLTAAIRQSQEWERADEVVNLANAYATVLKIDARVSTPLLIGHVKAIEGALSLLPASEKKRARDPQVRAASSLLRWHALTHPVCLLEARRLLREVTSSEPADGDALRFTYLTAWCAHVQGRGSAAAVEAARAAAERVGPVPEVRLMPLSDESPEAFAMLVRVLAGTEPPSRVRASSLADAAQIRPDAVELLLDVAEEQARVGFSEDPEELLQKLVRTLVLTYDGDLATRSRRMAALMVSVAPRLSAAKIAEIVGGLRGPVGEEVERALRSAGITVDHDAARQSETASLVERVSAMQGRALRLFEEAPKSRDEKQAISTLEEARRHLDEAMLLAKPLEPENRVNVHTSAGNARRRLAKLQPERARALLDEAIALYREALSWTRPDSDNRARVSKVLAEALIGRGIAADWEEAKRLFSEALVIRHSGQFRAETLMAVLDAELAHPSRMRAVSVSAALLAACEAMEHVVPQMEAMRLDIGGRAVSLLAELVRLDGVESHDAHGLARRITASCPKLREHAELATFGVVEPAFRGERHPIIESEFVQARVRASAQARAPLADRAMPPGLAERMAERTAAERLRRNNPAALRREEVLWREESTKTTGERRAGYLVGVARCVERRAELGEATPAELEAAFVEARESLSEITNLEVRAFALSDLAVVWSGHHAARDFARSARLLEESIRLYREAGAEPRTDTLQYLARAMRYREDIPRGEAIKAAVRMFQEAASEYRAQGTADGYMICLLNLAEALSLQQDRPRAAAIKEALAVERVALEIARLRGDREHQGMLLGNVAWGLTRLAEDGSLQAEERRQFLEEAGPLFEEAKKLTEDPGQLANIQNNYLNWLDLRGAPRPQLIANRRRQLKSIDRRAHPHKWSFAAHNLAELLVHPGASIADTREALSLYRDALAHRPIDASPELHHECAHQIGALLGGQRYPGQLPTLRDLGISPDEAYREATAMLQSAVSAGRVLGVGRHLVAAARTFGLVAADPPGHLPCDVTKAHEALEALADVLRVAPEDAAAAEAEAEVAAAVVTALAKQRVTGASRLGRHALLDGASAWDLVHLVLRARGGRHRRLRARLARPNSVDPATWTRWRRVLRERDNYTERRKTAEDLQKEAPEMLFGAPSLSATLGWLREGRAAASLVMTETTMLLVLLWKGDAGPVARVVFTDVGAAPVPETEAQDVFRAAIHPGTRVHSEAVRRVGALSDWLTESVVDALRRALPTGTVELCWSPNGVAAWMPLDAVWPDAPRIWTTPCLTLPPPSGVTAVDERTLLVCADPRAPGEEGALPDAGLLVARLADGFSGSMRAEVLAASGRAYGHALLPNVRSDLVTDRPASCEEVLARAQGRRLLLVLAHGTYSNEDPAKSALHLVDAEGVETPLTAEDISERPTLLKDTVVVLLSCESGAGGRLDAGPAGLPGALLSVGAQVVIAPLWPVLLDTAVRVGRAVVEHLARGGSVEELPDAVRAARPQYRSESAPDRVLDGPFVVWCG